MNESDDSLGAPVDSLKRDSSLSKPLNMQNNNGRVEYEQRNLNALTKIVYGEETIRITDKFAIACQSEINIIIDKNHASLVTNIPEIANFYSILKNNSVKVRIVTEITSDNMGHCNQIIEKYGTELRHLSDVKVNLAISDGKEYISFPVSNESRPLSEMIYSNVKEVANQNNLIFETLWKKAIPAQKRIKEIEKGLLPVETYLIDNHVKALSYVQDFIQNVDTGFSNSTPIGYFKLLDRNEILFQSYLQYLSKYKEGKVKGGVRWVTHIGDKKEDVELIRKFLDVGIEIKHVRNLPPLYFSVSRKQCVVTIENLPNGEMFQRIIHSSEPSYILHYQTVFEELWNMGINAQERIRQIETGTTVGTTKVIESPLRTKQYFIDLVKNSKEEIMILFPSHNAIKREVIMGIIDLLKKKSAENIGIRILSPVNEVVKQLLFPMETDDKYDSKENIRSREIRKQRNLISTIVIVDRKYVLATELKDDSKEFFEEAIGESTYSTSKPTVLSYISIFESLWDQTETSDSLKIANQKLIQSEQTEREFINTAAHELRTPTQAIMGYTEIDSEVFNDLLKNTKVTSDEELRRVIGYLKSHFDAVSRNSARLDQLINNLLDVARIESNKINRLQIHKQKLDIVLAVNDTINTELEQKIRQKNIKINFINELPDKQYWVYADKLRLGQIMNNLIGNAIKYSHQNGKIDVIIKENLSNSNDGDLGGADYILKSNNSDDIKEKKQDNGFREEILVGVSDMGKGISDKVMPKLFEKFITSSDTGTGLGLYITRNLVEAHGGKIWAYNNKDDVGSTFVFSLPKADDKILDNN